MLGVRKTADRWEGEKGAQNQKGRDKTQGKKKG